LAHAIKFKIMKWIIVLLFPTINSFSQNIDWNKTSDWKLYDIHTSKAFDYSLDTLNKFKNVSLDEDTLKMFLNNLSIIQSDQTPVWMGFYVASCKMMDGSYAKIDISVYGGFFYVEKIKTYFRLLPEYSNAWMDYLTQKGVILQSSQ
jgi:hypothetical protein